MDPEVVFGHQPDGLFNAAVHQGGVGNGVVGGKWFKGRQENHFNPPAVGKEAAAAGNDHGVSQLGKAAEGGIGSRLDAEKRHEDAAPSSRILVWQVVKGGALAQKLDQGFQRGVAFNHDAAVPAAPPVDLPVKNRVMHPLIHADPGTFKGKAYAPQLEAEKVGSQENNRAAAGFYLLVDFAVAVADQALETLFGSHPADAGAEQGRTQGGKMTAGQTIDFFGGKFREAEFEVAAGYAAP